MENLDESTKRLEEHVKRVSSAKVHDDAGAAEDDEPDNSQAAAHDASHIGSMVNQEEAFPTGMRRRVIEAPFGSKVGYHEVGDEKEDADLDWMLGEASQLSGAGTRGSSNWVLKIMVPILLIVGIICMHQWWTEIKESVSDAANSVGDAFDRRALEEDNRGVEGEHRALAVGRETTGEQQAGASDKVVYKVDLKGEDAK